MRTAKIGLDCRLSGISHGGIGRYEVEVFSRILSDIRFSYVVYLFDEAQKVALSSRLSGSDVQIEWRIVPIRHYTLAEQLKLPAIFNKDTLDLLHVPHFNVPIGYHRPTIVTIHDLLWHERKGSGVTTLPAWQYWFKHRAYTYVSSSAIRHATHVLVPSKTIKETVARLVPGSGDKISVTYEGVDPTFKPNSHRERDPHHLLYVGSLYPHKNVQLILNGLAELSQYHLTIVSTRTAFSEAIESEVARLKIQSRVQFEHDASDACLLELYQSVGALVQPSFSEGFGLTGIEALACHTPLVASNIPIFQEIYQDQATYFDPHSVASFIRAVATVPKTANTTGADALLSRYDWDTTARQTLDVYTSTVEKIGSSS